MFLEMRHSRPKEEEVDLWERILDPWRRVIGMDCEVERFKERLTGRGHFVRFKLEGNMFQLISTTFWLISIHERSFWIYFNNPRREISWKTNLKEEWSKFIGKIIIVSINVLAIHHEPIYTVLIIRRAAPRYISVMVISIDLPCSNNYF